MIELDVHQLADKVLVVFHDDEIGGNALADIGYGEFYECAVRGGIKVPTLDQTLEFCAGRIRIVVEVKSACAEDVVRAISKAKFCINEYVIASFHNNVLMQLRRFHPGVRTALLTEDIPYPEARGLLELVAPDLWAPDSGTLDDAVLSYCNAHHLKVLPWTVNDDSDLHRFLSAGAVAGIITDRTQHALTLRRMQNSIRSTSSGAPVTNPMEGGTHAAPL
jgi:glycerophosphoryl diester phosphodiesterase